MLSQFLTTMWICLLLVYIRVIWDVNTNHKIAMAILDYNSDLLVTSTYNEYMQQRVYLDTSNRVYQIWKWSVKQYIGDDEIYQKLKEYIR